jgi:hypothetical protein
VNRNISHILQAFVQAAKIVVPWVKEDNGSLRFVELNPFIFDMFDDTF